jgi:hypothetical protein
MIMNVEDVQKQLSADSERQSASGSVAKQSLSRIRHIC